MLTALRSTGATWACGREAAGAQCTRPMARHRHKHGSWLLTLEHASTLTNMLQLFIKCPVMLEPARRLDSASPEYPLDTHSLS